MFYFSVQSISPRHPRQKDDPCAGVELPVDTIENIHKLRFCLYWNYVQHPEPAGWHVAVYMDACPGKHLLLRILFHKQTIT